MSKPAGIYQLAFGEYRQIHNKDRRILWLLEGYTYGKLCRNQHHTQCRYHTSVVSDGVLCLCTAAACTKNPAICNRYQRSRLSAVFYRLMGAHAPVSYTHLSRRRIRQANVISRILCAMSVMISRKGCMMRAMYSMK